MQAWAKIEFEKEAGAAGKKNGLFDMDPNHFLIDNPFALPFDLKRVAV